MSLDKAVSIFDRYKEEILTFTANLGGKTEKVYLLQELLYDETDLVDYAKLNKRLKSLPSILTFYAIMFRNARRLVKEIDEDFDVWYATVAAKCNAEMVVEINAQATPAALKKPPTEMLIKGRVITNYPAEWEAHRVKKREAQGRLDMLESMREGLEASVKLIGSESSLVRSLLDKGLEPLSTQSKSQLSGYQDHSRKLGA